MFSLVQDYLIIYGLRHEDSTSTISLKPHSHKCRYPPSRPVVSFICISPKITQTHPTMECDLGNILNIIVSYETIVHIGFTVRKARQL